MHDDAGDVHAVTNWTKDQLKDMPEHKDQRSELKNIEARPACRAFL
jgi:hypothetical protein